MKLPDRKVPESWKKTQIAGKEWMLGYMNRHKELSLRKPESTSLGRSIAFNKHNVDEFFKNYEETLRKYKFSPERIFNFDESGVTTVSKPVKIVSTTGKKQVGQVSSSERGELVTFVGIINAAGMALPPVYVYPRKKRLAEFLTNGLPGSIALGSDKGWMTADLFPSVLQHLTS